MNKYYESWLWKDIGEKTFKRFKKAFKQFKKKLKNERIKTNSLQKI